MIMNVLVITCAVSLFLFSIISIPGSFVLLGKERGKFTATNFWYNAIEALMIVVMAGRIFAWW